MRVRVMRVGLGNHSAHKCEVIVDHVAGRVGVRLQITLS